MACHAYGRPLTCPGKIETEIARWPRRIEWWCTVCGNTGSIFGWEWSRWNRMDLWGDEEQVEKKKRKRKKAAAAKSAGSKLARKKASQVA